jgi:heme-degrading monooxygenase HmoA
MIIRIVKMTFREDEVPEFLRIFDTSKTFIRSMPGCRHLELLQDTASPNIFFTCSHWDSENDLNNYRNSGLFGEVWKKTKALFSDKPQAWSLEQKIVL